MKIVIDVSPMIYETGVSAYTKHLVENLLKIDKENEYILFGGSLRRYNELKMLVEDCCRIKSKVGQSIHPIPPTLADWIWNSLHLLPIERFVGKVDIFHSSDWIQPPSKAFKVTTIHDLAPLKYPEYSHPKIVAVHKRRLRWVRSEVDKIIAPSEATKEDLLEFRISEEKIVVIPEAANFGLAKKTLIKKVKDKYNISGRYLLSVGINPRKNTKRIIKAYKKVRDSKDLKLVLVGYPSSINIKEEKGLRIVGHVSNEELSALFTGAEVLVYPSLYEGFGIPILDAFNCKTPVVTSGASSMSEVAGNAAVLVDPSDTNSIVSGIKFALKNYRSFVKKGIKRVKKFSWVNTAKKTLDVYRELMKE
jgi:glycosyltransferase involved in cell wall biosynthesis